MGDHVSSSSSRYFCLGASLVFFGSILLCALGFTVVYPHHMTRNWPSAQCHVTNVTYDPAICSCGQPYDENGNCLSKYPCLIILIQYNGTNVETLKPAMLYRYWSDAFYQQCSLYECGDEHWNVRTVREFHKDFGSVGQTYECFYNPERVDHVVLIRTSSYSAIHALVWPCTLITLGSVVWIGLCMGCWKFQEDPEKYDIDSTYHPVPVRFGVYKF